MADKPDVIIVGGGLGGGLAAWQLTQYGKSVVVLEEGDRPNAEVPGGGIKSRLQRQINKRLGRAPAEGSETLRYYLAEDDSDRLKPVSIELGRGLGGSSALYSAALGRMRRSDFEGDKSSLISDPDALPNQWPLDFDRFRSYYRRVESLMRVRGDRDPADPDDDSQTPAAPPLGPGALSMDEALRANGLSPYRLRVGIDYVAGCKECFGKRCPFDCKADGYSRGIRLAELSGGLRVETRARVIELAQTDDGVTVTYEDSGGSQRQLTAHRVVMAAGALNSPLILARSRALWRDVPYPRMLGRGLMFHVSDLFMVVGRKHRREDRGPRKWLAIRDFYNDGRINVGEIQSTGFSCTTGLVMSVLRSKWSKLARGPGLILFDAIRPIVWLAANIVGRQPIVATITEDLPFARNHVREEDGKVVVSYHPSVGLQSHSRRARARLRKAFAPYHLMFVSKPGMPNWGHPMGTCRMGTDHETSVTDAEGRLHGHPNILVADASVFPSSGGTGPALTAAALGIRCADIIAADLAWQNSENLAVAAVWSKTGHACHAVRTMSVYGSDGKDT
ncbi:MAG: GMC family oxidoreductase [Pseudomonadota bacterium]